MEFFKINLNYFSDDVSAHLYISRELKHLVCVVRNFVQVSILIQQIQTHYMMLLFGI